MRGRRSLAAAASCVAVALAAAACGSSGGSSSAGSSATTADLPTVTVAVASGDVTPIPNGVIQLGVATGAFKKYGVNVKLVKLQGSAQTVQALVSDNADVANVDSADAIKLAATKKLDVRAINSSGANPDYVFVVHKDIGSIANLAGKTFAGEEPGSQPQLLLSLLLEQNHVDPSSVKTISLGKPVDRILSVINNRADATIVSASQWASLKPEQQNCCVLALDEGAFIKAAPLEAKVNVATTSTISKKRDALQKFTTALMELSRQYYKDPASWATGVAGARDDLTLSALSAQSVKPSFRSQWCVNGCLNSDLLTSSSAFLYGSSSLAGVARIPLSGWVDTSFVSASLKQIGVDPATDAVSG